MSGGPTSPTVFYHTLRTELSRRAHPQYPQAGWWSALRVADSHDENVRIAQKLAAVNSAYDTLVRSRWRQQLRDGTLKLVGRACDRWLRANGASRQWV